MVACSTYDNMPLAPPDELNETPEDPTTASDLAAAHHPERRPEQEAAWEEMPGAYMAGGMEPAGDQPQKRGWQ